VCWLSADSSREMYADSYLKPLFLRDLDSLSRQVGLYPDDALVWKAVPGWTNTGGTLVLHLVGNLRHFVGALLGGSGYVRDRDAEFITTGLSRMDLQDLVSKAAVEVEAALTGLDDARLQEPFPFSFGGRSLSTGLMLTHLAGHLTFHLGQIDYHRRFVVDGAEAAGSVSLAPLFDAHG